MKIHKQLSYPCIEHGMIRAPLRRAPNWRALENLSTFPGCPPLHRPAAAKFRFPKDFLTFSVKKHACDIIVIRCNNDFSFHWIQLPVEFIFWIQQLRNGEGGGAPLLPEHL